VTRSLIEFTLLTSHKGLSLESSTAFGTMHAIVRYATARRLIPSILRIWQIDLIVGGEKRSL
jgi:hypothetical protein